MGLAVLRPGDVPPAMGSVEEHGSLPGDGNPATCRCVATGVKPWRLCDHVPLSGDRSATVWPSPVYRAAAVWRLGLALAGAV